MWMPAGRSARAARITCASSGRPASGCSTFGSTECIRLPWPAARTTTETGTKPNPLEFPELGIIARRAAKSWWARHSAATLGQTRHGPYERALRQRRTRSLPDQRDLVREIELGDDVELVLDLHETRELLRGEHVVEPAHVPLANIEPVALEVEVVVEHGSRHFVR